MISMYFNYQISLMLILCSAIIIYKVSGPIHFFITYDLIFKLNFLVCNIFQKQ